MGNFLKAKEQAAAAGALMLSNEQLNRENDSLRGDVQRLKAENSDRGTRQMNMRRSNPKYILRNYMAQIAIAKAEEKDFSEVDTLLNLLAKPFDEQPDMDAYAQEPPDWAKTLDLSCSS